jgi:hypothetical protein
MENRDFFADIALMKHPINHTDVEIIPREITDKLFTECDGGYPEAAVFEDSTFGEKYEGFKRGMARLREKYAPFLENRMPALGGVDVTEFKEFAFRYAEKGEVFTKRDDAGEWENVTIPDYRGPAGKWRAYYKAMFAGAEGSLRPSVRAVLCFQCVDYKALVYVNGNYVGGHEGFFAPFAFDVTDYIAGCGQNELVIEIQNDVPTKGDDGQVVDGDKIYAATGPGWDDPDVGWHHCPPGAGVFGRVTLEYRPEVYIDDIFVRPDIDKNAVELRLGVMNYGDGLPNDLELDVLICPKNFEGGERVAYTAEIKSVGRGKNEYRYFIKFEEFRLWEPDTPYLYGIICKITKGGEVMTANASHFGMRKFVSDETAVPKGKFYLNNKPVILRGANEMGHLQQCVMKGDYGQLIDDILIAKLCNMNYFRLTQRPVQTEIYEYMDMLGMMNQSDLPLFGVLRRNLAAEALKQVGEMERLIRRHPSAVMVTFINEPICIRPTDDPESKFSRRYKIKGHRHLHRDELEAFFAAARKVIYIENPDRVVKNAEGDYDPPTAEGMPDFHTYTMWYTNHPLPIGKFMRGYLPPVKSGWMIGCGEYGAEGLDNEDVMLKRYPGEWLETDEFGRWYPSGIVKAQTGTMFVDWYDEQECMKDWIEASQTHQMKAARLMTDALRRRSDLVNHTAVHLLIDAFPSGWMKTLVGCDRVPKKAYYAYAECLVPYRVNLRCDRRYVYAGEVIYAEAWLLNDTSEAREGRIVAALRMGGEVLKTYEADVSIVAAYSDCAAKIRVVMPETDAETVVTLDAALLDENGAPIHAERMEFYVYPKAGKAAEKGNVKVVILPQNGGNEFDIEGIKVRLVPTTPIFYAASRGDLRKYRFEMLYNEDTDYIDFIARNYIESDGGEDLVYTYSKSGEGGRKHPKVKLPFVKKYEIAGGTLIVISLLLEGRLGVNANIDRFVSDCRGGVV